MRLAEMTSNHEYTRIIEIPELGLDDYVIIKTDEFSCGEGKSNNGRSYQGLCCNNRHYILQTPDANNFHVSPSGKVMPKQAWEIMHIDEGGVASVRKITDAAQLERIVNEECKGMPLGELDYSIN